MSKITALLVALTLIGSPMTSVVCITRCQHEPMVPGSCHDDMTGTRKPMIAAGVECGLAVLHDSPYVKDDRVPPGAAVPAVVPALTVPLATRTDAPVLIASPLPGWLQPPLVLRI